MKDRKPMGAIHFPIQKTDAITNWCWAVFIYCRDVDMAEMESKEPERVVFT